MKTLKLFLICLLFSNILLAQNKRINVNDGCQYLDGYSPGYITIKKSSNDLYISEINNIINSMSINVKVNVYEADVNNVLCTVYGGEVMIIYDPRFFNHFADSEFKDDIYKVIFAHEIGHIVNLHYLKDGSWWDELSADYFAGSYCAKNNIPIDAMFDAFSEFQMWYPGYKSSHPHWAARCKTLFSGYCNEEIKLRRTTKLDDVPENLTLREVEEWLALKLNENLITSYYGSEPVYFEVEKGVILFVDKNLNQINRIPIVDIFKVQLTPHDLGGIEFMYDSGRKSTICVLGGEEHEQIYKTKGLRLSDPEFKWKVDNGKTIIEDLNLLYNICVLVGEYQRLAND